MSGEKDDHCVLFQSPSFMEVVQWVSDYCMLALALTSKQAFSLVSPLINQTVWFCELMSDESQNNEEYEILYHYFPKKLSCRNKYLLHQNNLQLVTHLMYQGYNPNLFDLPSTIIFLGIEIPDNPAKFNEYKNSSFSWQILVDNLPATLKELCLSSVYFKDLNLDNLPKSVTNLTLQGCNHSIDHLPSSLSHLTIIDWSFNYLLDHLPSFLTHVDLNLTGSFNQCIDHLPSSLTHLSLGRAFNQSIDYLPSSLLYLNFSNENRIFDQPLDYLPISLQSISLSPQFKNSLDNLPYNLTYLEICTKNYPMNLDHLPDSVKSINIRREFKQPLGYLSNISSLILWQSFPGPNFWIFLPTLTILVLPDCFNQPVINLPATLTHLIFGIEFNQPINHILPHSLKYLAFKHPIQGFGIKGEGTQFNQNVDHLPPSLSYLSFGNFFNQPINHLPSSIIRLKLGIFFQQPISIFPSKLYSLIIHESYSHSLDNLPNTLAIVEKYKYQIFHMPFCIK